jgi:pimeloyl-ACP methyl ester carboxylesterase
VKAKPFAIVAHSNGGTIAIYGLSEKILHAKKLVLLASAGIRDQQHGRKKALNIFAKSGKTITKFLPRTTQSKLKSKFYKVIGSEGLLLPHLEETFRRVVSKDIQTEARKLTLSTLLVYGASDEATPPSYGRLLNQAIPGSKLEILDGAGHFVHREQPEKVASLLKEFLTHKT